MGNTIKYLDDGVTMVSLYPIQKMKMFKCKLVTHFYSDDTTTTSYKYMFADSKDHFIKHLRKLDYKSVGYCEGVFTAMFDECDYEEVEVDDYFSYLLTPIRDMSKILSRKPVREVT